MTSYLETKIPAMVQLMDDLSLQLYGRRRSEALSNRICVECGKPATEFKSDDNKELYWQSGMCQECQDKKNLSQLSERAKEDDLFSICDGFPKFNVCKNVGNLELEIGGILDLLGDDGDG